MKQSLKSIFVVLAIGLVAACTSDSDGGGDIAPPIPEGPNLIDVASENPNLTSFVAALEAASGNLGNVLSGAGPFTIFAPSDAAFTAFLDGQSLADVPAGDLQQLLLNHVISDQLSSGSLFSGYRNSESTAGVGGNNLSLLFIVNDGITINETASVQESDITATNGVIHIIDEVLALPTVADVLTKDPNLIEFTNALEAFPPAGTTFLEILADPTADFTMFAPSNQASNNFSNENGNDITNVIFNHIMDGSFLVDEFDTTYELTSMATNADGDNLSYFVDTFTAEDIIINGSIMGNAFNKDIVTTNGVVHIVESVIDLPTILTFAEADQNLETLIDLLDAITIPGADPSVDTFRELLANNPPFTIFAPLDSEVQDLVDAQSDSNTLVDILFHHVLQGNIRSEDLTDGLAAVTLQGTDLTFSLPGANGNAASITDAGGNSGIGVTTLNIQALDGVIHVVDNVLSPQ